MKMNHFLKFSSIVLCGIILTVSGCKKDDEAPVTPATNTITDVVVKSDDFSTLEAAVLKAKLEGTLSGAGPYTVFAPDNAAFTASGITSATLGTLTETQVKNILLYHTIGSKIAAAGVPAGPNAKVTTASGDSVFVTSNSSGVFINGIKVTQADISADNGIIHRINRVLLPAEGNVVQTAQIPAKGLDSLVKAIVRANNDPGGNPNLINTLSTSTITVFAPTNAAFAGVLGSLGFTDINQIPIGTLLAVLSNHVVLGRKFTSDLSNGNVTMLGGGVTIVNLTNGIGGSPTITGNGNGTDKSNIIGTNIIARNGVIHVIDKVLLP
jgi:uncharacterized surface protein with fasciclin (FAS1) repeats